MILIGDVGVGKTTFIRHLIKVDAPQVFNESLTFYIDLGSQANFTEKLNIFVPNIQKKRKPIYLSNNLKNYMEILSLTK